MMRKKPDADPDIATALRIDRSSEKKMRLRRWIAWGIPLLVVIVLSFIITRDKAEPVQFKTQAAERGDLTIIVTATGNLEPTNQVDVGGEYI